MDWACGRMLKTIYRAKFDGKRKPERPRNRWKDGVEADPRTLSIVPWGNAALDRRRWRKIEKEVKL